VELEHHFTVPASVEETWAAFNDPEVVAPCFPGATLISVDGDQFTGSAKIKLGPIALQYNGTGTYVERDEPARRAVIEAMGKDRRGNGTANATVTAQLEPDGDGTAVHVTTDLAVTGKPAQFGRGVMQDVSDKLLMQFVACLQTKLGSSDVAPASAEGDPAAQPSAPTAQPLGLAPDAGPPRVAQSAQSAPPAMSATRDGRDSPAGDAKLARSYRKTPPPPPEVDTELNLLRTVGAVLLTRYAARALGPVALIVGFLLGRSWGRRSR
jgi:carbon monoxide dehydrogenase subunit G